MFYGLDVHKEFIQVCAVDAKGAKRKEYRIGATAEAIEAWAQQFVSHRRLLVKQRVAIKNTIRAALDRRLVPQPEGEPFSGKARRWMRSLELPATERFLLHSSLDMVEDLDRRSAAVDDELLQAASLERQAQLLMTIPGVGCNVAVTALARKLVVLAWHLLQKGEPYRYAPAAKTREKLRAFIPRDQRRRGAHSPGTLEQVYREAGLPVPSPSSQAERRTAAVNRRARTRIANCSPRAWIRRVLA